MRALPWAAAGAPPERGAAAALLAVAAAWVVQALFEWTWDIPAVTLPVLLALGVLAARPLPGGARGPMKARGPAVAAAATAAFLFVRLRLAARRGGDADRGRAGDRRE